MNMLKSISLLILFVLGGALVSAQESDSPTAITLERTACFGTCPVYSVSILEDGTVLYNGSDFVAVTGEQTSQIEPEKVQQMVEAFEAAGYFEWDEAYDTQTVTDLPTITTSVTHDGETHQIVRYAGDQSAPLALPFLENWIDTVANTALFTGAQTDISGISNGTSTPVVTLERTACFGFCPIYSIAAYEDGTVVYTGIANVDQIGVQILTVDPAMIESVAMRADVFGYFEWQDNYDTMLMTDQPTIITSVRFEDNFKRIVRYDGDMSAPIGLVRIEEFIDQLVEEPAA
jgi:hypothetical protein